MPSTNLRRPRTAAVAAAALTGALVLGVVPAGAQTPSPDASAFGLTTTGRIVTFELDDPSDISESKRLTGLPRGSTVVGIDERPRTGQLYAVVKASDGTGSIYTVVPSTGVATLAAPLRTTDGMPIVLGAATYGVDFNPAADALRITGDDGQNLRVLPSDRVVASAQRSTGDTFVDGTLNYAGTTATGINASAYTQSLPATAGTTLFNVDTTRSALTTQVPPNDGTQVVEAGVELKGRSVQGFDIVTAGTTDTGYVALSTPPRAIQRLLDKVFAVLGIRLPARTTPTQLFEIDLDTGALDPVGTVAGLTLVDITVDTPAPPAG